MVGTGLTEDVALISTSERGASSVQVREAKSDRMVSPSAEEEQEHNLFTALPHLYNSWIIRLSIQRLLTIVLA